jgi:uncharacterized protein
MLTSQTLLRLNVGFIVHQSIGYSRDFSIEIPGISSAEDFDFEDFAGIVTVSRTTEGLLVQVKGQAQTKADCVLCLEQFYQQLHLDFVEMFTFPSHADKETELILPDDLNIDLYPLIREYFYLDIPISPICRQDCKGLCPVCGENLNHTTCSHDVEMGDSRLAVLKSLLDNDEASGA